MVTSAEYAERVYAGVLGKIIGVYLGRPFEQWSHDAIMERLGEITGYVHDRLNVPLVVTDDDISGTFTFLRALEDHGYDPNLTPRQIGETWLNYLLENRTILWWGGMGHSTEHTAYLRLKRGVPAPEAGSIAQNGKVVAEQIGAQIFIDGWGLICPGEPDRAADFARRAGSVSHDGEAIYGAQSVAAMVAQAFVEPDVNRLLDTATTVIPADSLIRRVIDDVRDWHAQGLDYVSGFRRIEGRYGYSRYGGGCHMVPNHAVIIHALVHGQGDFDRSMTVVNTCGYDTDCNSGNVGCIVATAGGLACIGERWRGPVNDRMYVPTADGARCVTDAAREALFIVDAARALRGHENPPRARFSFPFPGSTHGFEASGGKLTPIDGGVRLVAEGPASLETETFRAPDAPAMPGYGLLMSPTLYGGQTLVATVSAPAEVSVRLGVRVSTADGSVLYLSEPDTLAAGERVELEWTLPSFGPNPVHHVGVFLEQAGEVDLLALDWGGRAHLEGTSDLSKPAADAWINGGAEPGWGAAHQRFISNEGTAVLSIGGREWSDAEFEATLYVTLADSAGLAVRVQGQRRYVAVLVDRAGRLRLVERIEDQVRVLAENAFAWEFDSPLSLRIAVTGDLVEAVANDAVRLSAEGVTLRNGGVGVIVEEGRLAIPQWAIR